jgi:phosphoribosylformimino-5-aminoimidazole carboxamide ribotide isomerase
MSGFIVYPAIDLRGGQVVRLAQGDPDRERCYSDDPGAVARRWLAEGAEWLHVVNLDGALGEGGEKNLFALNRILDTGLKVQLGGGLRRMEDVLRAFETGVARVVFGTAAVETPGIVEGALAEFGPNRVALGVDTRAGQLRVRGWSEASDGSPYELAKRFARAGLRHAVVTDIDRDGMGEGINLELAKGIQERSGLRVIASGGAAGLADVAAARRAGLAGVIIGRALYEGRIPLAEALRC